jgi:hypothetical protein
MYEKIAAGKIEIGEYVRDCGFITETKIEGEDIYLHTRQGSMSLYRCDEIVEVSRESLH